MGIPPIPPEGTPRCLATPRRLAFSLVAVLAVSTLAVVAPSTTAHAGQPRGYGPADPFDDSILPDDGPQESVRDEAQIKRTEVRIPVHRGCAELTPHGSR